ncbi:MAG: sugar transferase [Thiotrichales bacterium]|nr:sugar transferase [Thiotrichales bacterium]
MRIAVTGASGFVGSQMVPRLHAANVELRLFSSNPARLQAFSAYGEIFDYKEMEKYFSGVDAILHLATVNNYCNSIDEARSGNVDFLKTTVEAAQSSGVNRFIFTSSFHAEGKSTPYAITKNEAEEYLRSLDNGMLVTILRLPAVYGDKYAGKLGKFIGIIPAPMKKAGFNILSSFKPTVHVDKIVSLTIKAAGISRGGTVIISDQQKGNFIYHFTRRIFDVLLSVSMIVLLSWMLLLLWLLIRMTSRGPGIFAQERVGQYEKVFTCYKFRTMKQGTMSAGTHTVSASNITAVGGFLRKTKLDELPQLFNIIANQMSFVGPRPCLVSQKELIEARRERGVSIMKVGITGYAQINGIDMSDPEKLADADAFYLNNRSLLMDAKILFRTFFGAGQGDRVKS